MEARQSKVDGLHSERESLVARIAQLEADYAAAYADRNTARQELDAAKATEAEQAEQIRAYRTAWKEAGHAGTPRVSVSRSIFALMNDTDHMYFGQRNESQDQIGMLHGNVRSIFGRSYAAEPETLIKELAQDEAIAEADTLMLTVPNQLGVAYNAHVIESILKHVAPELGWR